MMFTFTLPCIIPAFIGRHLSYFSKQVSKTLNIFIAYIKHHFLEGFPADNDDARCIGLAFKS